MNPSQPSQVSPELRELLLLKLRHEKQERDRIPSQGRTEEPARFPLSSAQQRLWFLDRYISRKQAYNVPLVVELEGPIRIEDLESSLSTIVERHEILRTTYAETVGEQRVHAPQPVVLEVHDLSGGEAVAETLEERLRDAVEEPFDLETGPIFAAKLYRRGPHAHTLLLNVHHIATDGWSTGILIRELEAFYRAAGSGAGARLPALPIQYADYAVWQRRRLEDRHGESQLAFWSEALADFSAVELPFDRPRPQRQSFSGALVPMALPADLADRLTALARGLLVTPFAVLLAAFKALLYRYTGKEEMIVGSPFANRDRPETENLIGFFVNTLPLRASIGGNHTAADAARAVHVTVRDAQQHQEVPFELLVEDLGLERDTRHPPIYQVVFNYQKLEQPDGGGHGLPRFTYREIVNTTSKFDLTVAVWEMGGRLSGEMVYDTCLLDAPTVARLGTHFEAILEAFTQSPLSEIRELPMLAPSELRQLLTGGKRRGTSAAAREAWPDSSSLTELFSDRALHRPDAVALAATEGQWTYGALDRRTDQLARRFRGKGVGPEVRVGLCLDRSAELVMALLGILKAGGAYVPLDPSYPQERLRFIAEDAGLSLICTAPEHLERLPEGIECDTRWSHASSDAAAAGPEYGPAAEHGAYVMYTSGSTGKPKGVVISHRNVVRLFAATADLYDFGAGDSWTLFHSYAFDFSVWEIWGALLHGGRLVIVPYWVSRSPNDFLDLLADQRVTVLNQSPSAFRQLASAAVRDRRPPALRTIIFGAEALDLESLTAWFETFGEAIELINMYGITETTVHVTHRRVGRGESGAASPIGKPIGDLEAHLLDAHGNLVPVGVAGEIFVAGPGLSRGYLGRPRLTAQRFVPHPFRRRPGDRLYRSGDTARRIADGELAFTGRNDEQVKIRGFRVELGEVQAVMLALPEVRDALVLKVPSSDGEDFLAAYVIAEAPDTIDVKRLRGILSKSLPEFMVPSRFAFLNEFPLTAHGKLDRRALPDSWEAAAERKPGSDVFASPTEEALAAIWGEGLGGVAVEREDNFFALGGDSIRSIRVLGLAKRRGIHFTLQDLFQHQTVKALARHVARGFADGVHEAETEPFGLIDASTRRALADGVEDAYPPSKLQLGMIYEMHLDPEHLPYHNVDSIKIRAALDRDAFFQSVSMLVERHPIFRTSFDLVTHGAPLQLVHTSAALAVAWEDLRDRGEREQLEIVRRYVETERQNRFDLSRPGLLRFALHRLAGDVFQFTLTECHAILDGWSLTSAIAEVFDRHFRLVERADDRPSPPPRSHYRDFIRREQEAIASEKARTFWHAQVADLTMGKLPRWPAGERRSAGINEVVRSISADRAGQLRRLASLVHVPLKSVFLAAHVKVLSLLEGSRDVVTGMQANGRPESEGGDEVYGLFLNAMPLRARLESGTWADLVQQMFQLECSALPFRNFPMVIIREMAGGDFFESFFNFVSFHSMEDMMRSEKVEIVGEGLYHEPHHFPLMVGFNLDAVSGEVTAVLQSLKGEIPRPQLQQIANYTDHVLDQLIATADAMRADEPLLRHDRTRCLSAAEVHQTCREWNATETVYVEAPTLRSLLDAQAAATPDAVAVVFEDEVLTYRGLGERASRLGRWLAGRGVGEDSRVAVCLYRSSEMIVAILGVLAAGGAYVPLDPSHPSQRLLDMLDDTGADVVLTVREIRELHFGDVADRRRVVCLGEDGRRTATPANASTGAAEVGSSLAYMIYTSGSTGRPKGVLNTHEAIRNRLLWQRDYLEVKASHRFLQKTPYSFDVSVWELFLPLITGATLVISRPEGHKDPEYLAQLIERQRISILHFVPSMLEAFLEFGVSKAGLESIEHVVCSGEALEARQVEGCRRSLPLAALHNLYGPTEAAVDVSFFDTRELSELDFVPIGRPIANTGLYVLDRNMEPVPLGTPGELLIGGIGLARGYHRRPSLTAQKFLPHPHCERGGERLYRTGDLARFLTEGNIEFLGRLDHQVKIRGFRIELGEIEAMLAEHPGIRSCLVTVRETDGLKRLVAYVAAGSETGLEADALRGYLATRLPEYMVPNAFVFLDAFPVTVHGKLDRERLLALELEDVGQADRYVAPVGATEEALAEIWAGVLGVERVGREDHFFSLGGDSILSLRALAAAQKRGLGFELQDFYRYGSVRDLAHRIDASAGSPDAYRAAASREFDLISEELRARLPADAVDAYPMAQLQLGMLYHMELDPDLLPYHNVDSALFRAPADERPFREAVQLAIDRHPVLRTGFYLKDFGEPLQVVHERAEMDLTWTDLRHLSEAEQEEAIAAFLAAERRQLFDVRRPPLLRYGVHRLSDEAFRFTMTENHIMLDGWSFNSIFAEIFGSYFELLKGREVQALPPPEPPYREFVRLETAAIESQASRRFWRDRLAGCPRVVVAERPQGGDEELFKSLEVVFPGEDLRAHEDLARRWKVPLKSLFLAAHLKAVAIMAGSEEVVTGVVHNGRPETESGSDVFGLFLNTIPFRLRVEPEGSWRSLVARVFEEESAILPHRRLPMTMIQREVGTSPLYEVTFNYISFHSLRSVLAHEDFEFLGEIRSESPTHYPLAVHFNRSPVDGELVLLLQVGTPAISRRDLEAVGELYRQVLASLADQREPRVEPIPILRAVATAGSGDFFSLEAPAGGDAAWQVLEPRSGADPGALVLPSTPREELLAELFSELLGRGPISIDRSFFDLGGHSLLAMRLASRIRDSLHVELPLREIFAAPTVAGLAERIEGLEAPASSPAIGDPGRRARAEGATFWPLSFSQRRLWFLDQLQPDSPAYNLPFFFRLRGDLRFPALAASLEEIVRRHQSLRTVMTERDGKPVQSVLGRWDPILIETDLRNLSAAPAEEEARRLVLEESVRPFSLDRGPFLRGLLIRLGGDDQVLALSMHHIASDGWSIGILARELEYLYRTAVAGRRSTLPELGVQYPDYALWQTQELASTLEAQLDYWKHQLRDLEPLDLPLDRPRSVEPNLRGDTWSFEVPHAVAELFATVTRPAGLTPFMAYLAAFQLLLHRVTGQRDVAVGTPIAGRGASDLEPLIGFFVNNLVLRTIFAPGPSGAPLTARELFSRVRAMTLEAYSHEYLPFEKLVEALQPERDLSRTPLFDVMFTVEHPRVATLDLVDLEFEPFLSDDEAWSVQFDLSWSFEQTGDGVRGAAEYRCELFDATTLQRLSAQGIRLLDAMAHQPDRAVAELDLLGSGQRQQLLVEWNDSRRDVDQESLLSLIAERARALPDAIAVVSDDLTWSYGALLDRVTALARGLRWRGVGPEARVGIFMERCPQRVVALLGVLESGAAFVPIDPEYPAERVAWMLRDSRPEAVLCAPRDAAALEAAGVPVLDPLAVAGETGGERAERTAVADPGNLAYVIYTSGSTGRPKGVAVSHRSLVNHMRWLQDAFPLEPGDSLLHKTAMSFDPSVSEVLAPLWVGARLCVARPGAEMDPHALLDAVERWSVTTMEVVPSQLRLLVKQESFRRRCRNLKVIYSGGEALTPELAERVEACFAGSLVNTYGPTEATIQISTWRGKLSRGATVPLGRPITNALVWLVDRGLRPVHPGARGEIAIGGGVLARGYLGRPRLTAEPFVPDPLASEPGARLYRSGDLGRWSRSGDLVFEGRCDQQVKLHGIRLEPAEIESALGRIDGVDAAVVMLAKSEQGDRQLVAWVAAGGERPPTPAQLREALARALPAPFVPSVFVIRPELPLNPSGKIDRRALPRPEQRGPGGRPPAGPTETLLAMIWEDVLGVGHLSADSDFFALGGHSLFAIQVVSRIRAAFGIEVPLRGLFEAPTIAGLARLTDGLGRASHGVLAPIEPRRREGAAAEAAWPLSFSQRRLWFIDQLQPQSPAYHLPYSIRLRGPLEVAALAASLEGIVRRHESLRTFFDERDGEPVQRVAASWPPILTRVDLGGLPAARAETEARRLAAEEAVRPFRLAEGPFLRVRLIRLGAGDHVLALTLHHIASDGWSVDILVDELEQLYRAAVAGEPSPLPELLVQYADYALWQHEHLSAVLDDELAYWQRQLADLEPLALPLDRARSAEPSPAGATWTFGVPQGVAHRFTDVLRAAGMTPFMGYLAAFQLLLHRVTGQRDIAVGTPIAGRGATHSEPMIGFFVNNLVLRTTFGPGVSKASLTSRELFSRVRAMTLEAYSHEHLPFEKLVEALQPERDLSRTPLFDVMFTHEHPRVTTLDLVDLEVEPFLSDDEARRVRFDLTWSFEQAGDDVRGVAVYRSELFDATTIRRLAGQGIRLLDAMTTQPDRAVAELDLSGPGQRQQLLVEWNDSGVDQDSLPSLLSGRARALPYLSELFERRVAERPHGVALVSGSDHLSYGELNRRADQIANHLRSWRLRLEEVVAVVLERSTAQVTSVVAVIKAGGAYLPLDPVQPRQRIRYMIEDARVRVVISLRELAAKLGLGSGTSQRLLCVDELEAEGTVEVEGEPAPWESGIAYVIYTSGSTGRPKGTELTHGGLNNLVSWHRRTFGVTPSARASAVASPGFDASVWEVWPYLTSGAAVCLAPPEIAASAPDMVAWLAAQRITMSFLPTPLAEAVLGEELPADLALQKLLTGGDRLHFGPPPSSPFELVNNYGPTEGTVVTTWMRLSASPDLPPIGRPLDNTRAYVVDRAHRVAPLGWVGELQIGGVGLARCYRHRPGLTAEKFTPDAFSGETGGRLYRAGDQASYLADGTLQFLGRSDQQVKVRGFRIELGEIESALLRIAGVDAAVAMLAKSEQGGQQLVAWVAAGGGRPPTPAELREALSRTLPAPFVPSVFVVRPELPLSPSGKIDRRALPEPQQRGPGGRPPEGPTETLLAMIWEEVLGVGGVSAGDDFFALGGHSLFATQVVSRIRAAFGIEVPLRALFEAKTIAELARVTDELGRANRGVLAPIEPRRRAGSAAEAAWPLSFSQRRLWFIDQLQPQSPAYNQPYSIRLRGPLEVAALAASLEEIVRRHESLRTLFDGRDGEPVQRVAASWPPVLTRVDLGGLPAALAETEAKRLAVAESVRAFQLAEGPFLRARLIRMGAGDHVLALTLHHIASDGWSVGILIRELEQLYRAAAAGEPSPLPELVVQYADYAVWQQEHLSAVLDDELAYWLPQLAGLEPLAMPLDRARSAEPGAAGESWAFAVPRGVADRYLEALRAAGVTPFMGYLAAFQLLLHRVTGQRDVAVGTPIAGRGATHSEPMIGFFVNNLVLRTTFMPGASGEPLTARELFSRVRAMALEAYSHEHLPFEKLVEALQPERDLSRTPLFDVMFTVENSRVTTLDLVDLELEPFLSDDEARSVEFDLSWSFERAGDGVRGVAVYRSALFDATTLQRLAAQGIRLLDALAHQPDRAVAELDLLGPGQRQQLSVEWNDSRRDLDQESLPSLIAGRARALPDAIAVVSDDLTLSYGALLDRVTALARGLRLRGVGPEALVGIFMERCPERVIALLGVLESGAAFLPIDPEYPAERIAWMLRDSRPKAVLCASRDAAALPASEVPVLDPLAVAGETGGERAGRTAAPDPGNLAYVIYTSGSTGRPKGVAVSHRSLANVMRWQQATYSLAPGDAFLHKTAMSFDPSIFEVLTPLWVGARLCLAPPGAQMDPDALLDAVERWSVTLLNVVPSLLGLLVQQEDFGRRCRSLDRIYSGGEVLTPELAERVEAGFAGSLINLYGPTEATIQISSWRSRRSRGETVSLGRPITNALVRVVDRGLRPVPPGARGEIAIGGVVLARGYLGRPRLTAELFVPDPLASEPGTRLYRSGDLGRWSRSGELVYEGRSDHQVKLHGIRLEPAEIESALRRVAGVEDAVALVLRRSAGAQLIAFVKPSGGQVPDAATLREHLRSALPESMIPHLFIERPELPLSPSGKVDRGALAREAEREVRRAPAGGENPRDRFELQLVRLFEELLGVDRVGIEDDFFALGGHSLLAVQLLHRVEKAFGVDLPLALLFQESSVDRLAETVRRRLTQDADASPLLPIRVARGAPAWYFVHPVGGQVHWYLDLARELGDSISFYGLQAPGLASLQRVRSEIPEMAREYVAAIREAQPEGPYRLGGWSYGGLVAFEMARQLEGAGERVEPLVLIDSVLRARREARPQTEIELWLHHLADVGGSRDIDRAAWRAELEPLDRESRLRRVAEQLAEWGGLPVGVEALERMLAVHFAMTRAVERYEVEPLAGAGVLVRAEESARDHVGIPALRESFGWRPFFEKGLAVHDVPGDHYSILATDGARLLAEILRRDAAS